VARFTDVVTGAPAGIQRIGVRDGHKVDKFSKGPVSGCVVRLWPNDAIKNGIVLGEGVETTLAASTRLCFKGTLLRPAWATCGTATMQIFPVLSGIEFLTILVDNDTSQAGQKAAAKCAARWRADGRHVLRLIPKISGSDFNDLIR
jgi:Toprim domain